MVEMKEWDGFDGRLWKEEINVRQFIQDNYTPYEGNEDFLTGPTESVYGMHFRNCKKKNVPRAACLIWRPRWFQV